MKALLGHTEGCEVGSQKVSELQTEGPAKLP